MAFFWVNLGKTYQEVANYNFLWAPSHTRNKKGAKTTHQGWLSVQGVQKGDIIFCNRKGKIIYIAVAKTDGYEAPRPESRNYDQWKQEGFKVDVVLTRLTSPVNLHEFKDELFEQFNSKTSPKLLTVNRTPSENYMSALPDGAGALLLDAVGEESIAVQANAGNTESKRIKQTEREAICKSAVWSRAISKRRASTLEQHVPSDWC